MEVRAMSRNLAILISISLALAVVAGCNDGTIDPSGDDQSGVSAAAVADILLQSDVVTDDLVDSELAAMNAAEPATSGGGSGTVTKDVEFSLTRPCLGGGQFSMEGTLHRSFNFETGEMEAQSLGTRTRTDCTYTGEEFTFTVNSEDNWELFRRRVNGRPDGPQTSSYWGSVTVMRSDGAERSCDYEIDIVRDPETHTRTLDGLICNTEVHRSVTWSHEE
jgi:hypothetical protein